MSNLKRTEVDKFKIDEAITLEELEQNKENQDFLNQKILKIENIFKDLLKIDLNSRKKELFLNGVMLTFNLKDGVYNIYSETDYVGLGVVKNKLLKRDIII